MTSHVDVLIVEDNEADVELMRVTIEDHALPYRLHVAQDGEEALAFLHGGATVPQLVLLDFNMPRLGGLEVLQALHEAGPWPLAVVMFTSSEAEQDRQAALALGAAAYIVKPVLFEQYCQVVTNILHTYAPVPNST